MTTNRFVKGQPSATVSEPVQFKHPKFCEIPGCKTRYIPGPIKGKGTHACGAADVLVKDRYDVLRGICAEHYHNELVRQGKASNQDLLDHEGRLSLPKIKDYWESTAQAELDAATMRPQGDA